MNTLLTQSISSATWSNSVQIKDKFGFKVTGTWSGIFNLQVSNNNVEWSGLYLTTVNLDKEFDGYGKWYRFGFSSYTSGTAVGYLYQTKESDSNTIITTADLTLTTADLGKRVIVNSASNLTITFPSVDLEDDGKKVKIIKANTGKVTNQASDSDLMGDSSAGGTCYNDTSEIYAWLEFEYVDAITTWIFSGHGTWTTT